MHHFYFHVYNLWQKTLKSNSEKVVESNKEGTLIFRNVNLLYNYNVRTEFNQSKLKSDNIFYISIIPYIISIINFIIRVFLIFHKIDSLFHIF